MSSEVVPMDALPPPGRRTDEQQHQERAAQERDEQHQQQRTSGDGAPSGRATAAGRLVRQNVWRAFRGASMASKMLLGWTTLYVLAVIAAACTVVALSVQRGESCESPLAFFVIAYAVRLMAWLPCAIWLRLYPPPQRTPTSPPRIPTTCERIKSLLELIGVLLFVAGNWWLFTGKNCAQSAPLLFYFTVTAVALNYLMLLLPILLIISIICCLPLVLFTLRLIQRVTGVDLIGAVAVVDSQGRVTRATREEVIQKITPFSFARGQSIADEDAQCSICLSDYADGELVKRLPGCRHHFHAACVDEWLHLNKTCPLCVRDVELELERELEQQADNESSPDRRKSLFRSSSALARNQA